MIATTMRKYTLLLIITSLLASINCFACRCSPTAAAESFQRSSFVATIKLIKITRDSLNANYHNAEIEVLTLYKGQPLKTIKIASVLKTSCRFLPPENSTWLVFASIYDGILSFGGCSSSLESSGEFESESLTLDFLSKHHITDTNPSKLTYLPPYESVAKKYNNRNKMAVYRIDVNTDLSINKITSLQKFDNKRLNRAYLKILKKGLQISKDKKLTKPTYLIVFCYYGGNNPERTFIAYT